MGMVICKLCGRFIINTEAKGRTADLTRKKAIDTHISQYHPSENEYLTTLDSYLEKKIIDINERKERLYASILEER